MKRSNLYLLTFPALIAWSAISGLGCRARTPETSIPATWAFPADEPPVRASHGMVVATDVHASEVGVSILKAGGNAADAAVATGFALAVINPEAGNIGGGGFLVLRLSSGETAALDFREKAPLAATRDMYLDDEGNVTEKSLVGHLASGVPGSVLGLWELHARYGTLPWKDLLQPAIELSEGLEVTERFRNEFPAKIEYLSKFEASREIWIPNGEPPELGSTFRQPELRATLTRIRDEGPDDFYRGETARLLVEEMKRGGGLITLEDLDAYAAVWREPVAVSYRDYAIVSMPPSSSGGATLAEAGNILEHYDLASMGFQSAEHIHLLAEAFRRAFADRNAYLGDPDFVKMPLERMISKAYADERRADISLDRATPSTDVGPGLGPVQHGESTTHYSIVDDEGNAVSVTTTLNSFFGSGVTVAGAGFVLNNEMDDFAAKPGMPNQYGLVQGEQNAVEAGKRMLSAMTPTIVLDPEGKLFMVTGGPGGARIITSVFQSISNVVDFGMNVRRAVNAPRVHHQHLPDTIAYEPGGLSPARIEQLEAMGHTLTERSDYSSDIQAIVLLPDGTFEGASDPRRGGKAVGY